MLLGQRARNEWPRFQQIPQSHCGNSSLPESRSLMTLMLPGKMKMWWPGWPLGSAASMLIAILCFAGGAAAAEGAVAADEGAAKEWEEVAIPQHWRQGGAGAEGFSWYRCFVQVPEDWNGHDLQLFLEPVDDARAIYFNGRQVAQVGQFPPQYRSGLGEGSEHTIPAEAVHYGKLNMLAVRVYQYDGRGGFNVGTPAIFGAQTAIRLEGPWQFYSGEPPEAERPSTSSAAAPTRFVYKRLEDREQVAGVLRRLENDAGPLSPQATLSQLHVADDLEVQVALAEPHLGQPVSFKFDERGRLWVVQYLQYPLPAGLRMVSRDQHLRTVYDKIPAPPPHHTPGRDKITIHEDRDGDGVYDHHQTFIDGLNIVSSFAVDADGVWVLNPPYLLFYPDRNRDDRPDGDPEVHLEGFGIEDSHSIVNSLRFGPDGWLYAAQGSTVTGNVKRPGSADKPVQSMGQLIWRYHPTEHQYEIFAEGGGNAFGVEIDCKGRIYSGHNGGNTRGFHYVQGGYYQKGFGKHGALSNPYAFGYFLPMAHASVPRFTHTFILYEADHLPDSYRGDLLAVAPLQSHLVQSEFKPHGSTFQTVDVGHPLTSDDNWVRPVDIQLGPDGAVYVADFYEQRIDHASHYQGRVHRGSGRIYRLVARDSKPRSVRLEEAGEDELLASLSHPNRWVRQTALRLIDDFEDSAALRPRLEEMLSHSTGQTALEAFWGLHLAGGLTEELASQTLHHEDPYVRLWTVRLLCDDGRVSDSTASSLAALAEREPHVEVRSQLASSTRRLPASQGLPIVRQLLRHDEDADDPHLPLLLWWAVESFAASNRDEVVHLLEESALWELPLVKHHLLARLMQRYAQAGRRSDLLVCARLLELAPEGPHVQELMEGFEAAFEGRALPDLPDELVRALSASGGGSLALRLRQDNAAALDEALGIIADSQAPVAERMQYIQVLGQIKQPRSVKPLLAVVQQTDVPALQSAALTALQSFTDPSIAATILQEYAALPAEVRETADVVLSSRQSWSIALLDAVANGKIDRDQVSMTVVRKMLLDPSPQIEQRVRALWGEVQGATTEQMRVRVGDLAQVIQSGTGNPYNGKEIFHASCGKCHVLFEEGGLVGPDLTSYKRDDLQGMLLHVVNPSAEIREGFENYLLLTDDGRALNGFIADEDNQVVVLRGVDGHIRSVPRDEIDEMRAVPQSLMPEGILDPFSDQQVRDLFAYLRATQPLP